MNPMQTPVDIRLWWSPAAFCQHSDVWGATDMKSFRWQKFLCRRPSPVEHSPINTPTNWCQFWLLQATL